MIHIDDVILAPVAEPEIPLPAHLPELPDETYALRLERVLAAMKKRELEYLVIYADREHYGNFDYLTGFGPRFEEGALLLRRDGKAAIALGNECYEMYKNSRLPAEGYLHQPFSLPNQPMDQLRPFEDILSSFGISAGARTGIVGWKLMYPVYGDERTYDVPSFFLDSVVRCVGAQAACNATDLFIHPDYGVRVLNTAAEIARFEYGAAYASSAVQNLLRGLRAGATELELSMLQNVGGIPPSCFQVVSSGARIDLGLVSPSSNVVRLGDRFNCCVGLVGGLTCRTGFVAAGPDDLPAGAGDYIQQVAAPYYSTVVNWYEKLAIGVSGGSIYDMIQAEYPQEKYGWTLNPGHLTATEEWISSPIYPGSGITLKSGMCIQLDIIPAVRGAYAGANCEDGMAIADEALRAELARDYPEVYRRIEERRRLMTEALHIRLAPEVLPLSNIAGLYRPYLLNRELAFVVKR